MQTDIKSNRSTWILGAILAAILVVLLIVFFSLSSIVKTAIVRYGSDATQTPVQLNEAKISVFTGRAKLTGLTVCNPEGYSTPYVVTVERVWMEVNRKSLFSDQIRIEHLELIHPTFVYERSKDQLNNVEELLGGIRQTIEEEEKDSSLGSKYNISVDRILVKEAELMILFPGNTTVRVPLPDFEVRNVGGENGVSPAVLTEKVFLEFKKEADAPEIERLVKKAIDDIGVKIPEHWQKGIMDQIERNLPKSS